ASILTGVNISNNFFAAIVISFGIGASSMQLPCVFTLLQSMVPAHEYFSYVDQTMEYGRYPVVTRNILNL
ncbi:hypothetical protein ACSLOO_28190, partial [Klebsiella pneumoniae]|uniref:hypothetical protein n=1 Tax=Klebsiella pneumoniae TaxID=573 RepID=UPI003EE3A541